MRHLFAAYDLTRDKLYGHRAQGSMIRCYTIWRNKHTADIRLRTIVTRVNVA
ncbi:hypothetical protein [Streptomyces viridosporus]|uniref:hypothetical protein n=1 Tax=Streptomyces viridosporus TaxID=67581 RepID=UPI00210042AA|nr:hypothetical protein [Streptomyces viridosporus]